MSMARPGKENNLHIDLPGRQGEELPRLAAAFLILFDVKAGYTIAWKRSIPGLELSESVEFKSLPSGLHNIAEDLIYFVHDEDFAGISAFVNEPAEESDRNALMLAVGALLPLSAGRLGKSWKHAEELKTLAKKLSKDPSETQPLQDFWDFHGLKDEDEQAARESSPSADKAKQRQDQPSSNGEMLTRKRAVTSASALAPPGQTLSLHHPALSLPVFLDVFGPLVFPIYKAALLRRRVLLVGQAPVELACNFVYDISILSGIPRSVADLLPLEPLPTRLYTLFAVGVHDMQSLANGSRDQLPDSTATDDGMGYGWVANSTDDILATKTRLYDTLISLPPAYTAQAAEKVWPKVELEPGREIKATQRDLRRYRTLRRQLCRYENIAQSPRTLRRPISSSPGPDVPFQNPQESYNDASSALDAQLAEPQSWSALAYSSFMWWASAGENRTDLDEEEEYDAALLHDFDTNRCRSQGSPSRTRKSPGRSPGIDALDRDGMFGVEMRTVAYFHRLTTLILKTLSDIIDASDYVEDDDAGDSAIVDETDNETRPPNNAGSRRDDEPIAVTTEDMSRMGLDIWSESDKEFVRELVALYWGRKADVRGAGVECCGVRIC